MKIIIVGSSIAGSALALALSKHAEVSVYEQKSRKEVANKTCANICTASIGRHLKALGINEDFSLSRYSRINISSKQNFGSFQTKEYEIDRKRLLKRIIEKAERNKAVFSFSAKFIGFERERKNLEVFFQKGERIFSDKADILIGADGAVSEVAKKAGLFKNRRFFLYLQAKVKRSDIKNKLLIPERESYNIFVGKSFGYYSYIFPSKDGKLTVGLGECFEDASSKFKSFLRFLGIRKTKIEGALVPYPKIVGHKKGIYLIGDANCNVKYTGGGIVPALEEALALKERIIDKKCRKSWKVRRKILLNSIMTRAIKNMGDRDFDRAITALKSMKPGIFASRDELKSKGMLKIFSRLFWIGLKNLF